MADPSNPKDTAAVQHWALSSYEGAIALLEHKVGFLPDNTVPHAVDEWVANTYTHWCVCNEFWKPACVKCRVWNDLEFSLLEQVARLDQDDVLQNQSDFNELALCAREYGLHAWPIPLPSRTPTPVQASPTATPAPNFRLEPKTPIPQDLASSAPRTQQSTAPAISQRLRSQHTLHLAGSVPMLNLSAANSATKTSSSHVRTSGYMPVNIVKPPMPRFTTPLTIQQTGQPATAFPKKVMPMPITSKLAHPSRAALSSLIALAKPVDALKSKTPLPPADSTAVFQKDWSSPLHGKSQAFKVGPSTGTKHSEDFVRPSSSRLRSVDASTRPIIIPGPDLTLQGEGTSSAMLRIHEPLFLPGTDDEEECIQEDMVETRQDEVAFLRNDGDLQGQDDDSPAPPQDDSVATAEQDVQSSEEASPPPMRHRRTKPRISFVFDDLTGDFVDSDPTIFLPRLAILPATSQDLRQSARSHTSPSNPTAAYLKLAQGSKPDMKKQKRDTKGKDKASEIAVPRKCVRNEDEGLQTLDKPAAKKLKSKGRPLTRSKLFMLLQSGGGFGEKVPSTAKAINHGIMSIGVLKVDKDFGEFVEVDKSYWSKAVVPFVGERYTTAFKCMHCHYSKLPCKVDGVAALNPIDHYRPKGSDAVNTFEATINAIKANSAAITAITQQFLVGLNVIAHTDNICAQMFQLHGCLAPVEEDEEVADKESEDEAPNDVTEGIAGPSQKKKGKLG
ncbi:hypothetical protein ARMGADRAFT_1083491 [Armillaria gallica]|uniref:Uncharacterized protein n=1 Tax=Armillaria gallica TaxID=47427 RepID=A0A2H3D6W9_ARMGA|nr:hypothetical protein ARMGADRAFT_1083491 [Armillaria gallica]